MPAEQHPLAGQPVEVRRADDRMANRRQALAAPLVDGNEEDLAHDSPAPGRAILPARVA
jgi:hypothetical protein